MSFCERYFQMKIVEIRGKLEVSSSNRLNLFRINKTHQFQISKEICEIHNKSRMFMNWNFKYFLSANSRLVLETKMNELFVADKRI